MKPLVSVNDLVAYRMGELFHPFTLEIECGEMVIIQGANGCGKSTVLDCLCGRYADWTGKLSARSRSLSYLPQQSEHPRRFRFLQLLPWQSASTPNTSPPARPSSALVAAV